MLEQTEDNEHGMKLQSLVYLTLRQPGQTVDHCRRNWQVASGT